MIEKILNSLKLNYEDLSAEEKATFQEYDDVLSKEDIKIEDINRFISTQKSQIGSDLANYKNSEKKDIYLKARMRNIELLEVFILAPKENKKRLIADLKNKFKIKD